MLQRSLRTGTWWRWICCPSCKNWSRETNTCSSLSTSATTSQLQYPCHSFQAWRAYPSQDTSVVAEYFPIQMFDGLGSTSPPRFRVHTVVCQHRPKFFHSAGVKAACFEQRLRTPGHVWRVLPEAGRRHGRHCWKLLRLSHQTTKETRAFGHFDRNHLSMAFQKLKFAKKHTSQILKQTLAFKCPHLPTLQWLDLGDLEVCN